MGKPYTDYRVGKMYEVVNAAFNRIMTAWSAPISLYYRQMAAPCIRITDMGPLACICVNTGVGRDTCRSLASQ